MERSANVAPQAAVTMEKKRNPAAMMRQYDLIERVRRYNPNTDEALLQQASDTVPENRIIQVVSKGYKLKSKILKHAKVIVSQGPQG